MQEAANFGASWAEHSANDNDPLSWMVGFEHLSLSIDLHAFYWLEHVIGDLITLPDLPRRPVTK